MYKSICVFLSLSLTITIAQDCSNGAQCMNLDDCKNVHSRLQQGNAAIVLALVKNLVCGFDGDQAKICCPPDFPIPYESKKREVETSVDKNDKAIELLPNTTICGVDYSFANRISGGETTQIEEHPWTALLYYGQASSNNFRCGGVLISSRYVLTAAHCVRRVSEDVQVSQVRLGEWDLARFTDCSSNYCTSDTLNLDVEETVVHENYIPGHEYFHNDIALLRLAQEVSFSSSVKPICLPIDKELRENTFENFVNAEIAGWGESESSSFTEKKMKAVVPIVKLENCKEIYKNSRHMIIDNQICAGGERGKDVCRGDSGGPLMLKINGNWMAVGVVSFGPTPCGVEGWPSVYTRVTSYIDWILAQIRP